MLEKGRISPYQLFCMTASFLFGTSVLLQSLTAAGRDTWISMVFAVFAGLAAVTLLTSLAVRFPNMTLIEYVQVVFGKIPGKIIGALYLWYFLHLGALVLRNFGEFLTTEVMPETPLWFFQASLAMVVAFLIYNRLEVMGRVSELILPLSVVLSITTSVLIGLSHISEVKNLFPILERGLGSVLLGAAPIAAFPFLEVVVFAMMFPYVNNMAQCRKTMLGAVIFSGFFLFFVLLQDIIIFGEYMAGLTYPRFYAVKLIAVGNFIERIEPVALAIWIMSGMLKLSLCLYAFVLGLAQLLELKEFSFFIIPGTVLTVALSIMVYENTFQMLNFAVNIYPVYAFPFQVGFPVLMLILAVLKKRNKT